MEIKPEMLDLVRAFNEARLAALHIDMQECFYYTDADRGFSYPTDHAFPAVNDFAQQLRQLSIRNDWVVYTQQWGKESFSSFARRIQVEAAEEAIHSSIFVAENESVFNKDTTSAFRDTNCLLRKYLDGKGTDTLIIDGIKAYHCLAGTAADALKKNFRVYVPIDVTDKPDQLKNYAKWFLRPNDPTPQQKARITFTSTTKILEALRMAQKSEFQKLIIA